MSALTRWPLTYRILLLSALGILGVTIISTLIARQLLQSELSNLRDRELQLLAQHVAADAREGMNRADGEFASFGPPRFSEIFSGAYWQIGLDAGAPLAPIRSRSLWDTTLPASPVPPDQEVLGEMNGPVGQTLRTIRLPITFEGKPASLTVGLDVSDFQRIEANIGRLFLMALVAEGLLALLAATLIAFLSLRSMRRFNQEMADLRAGKIERLSEDVPDEVAVAAQEVNALKTAQTNLINRAREQAGALAHSLKTPLSIIIQAAEKSGTASDREVRAQAQAALDHVHHHLALARSAGPGVRHAVTRLLPVVEGIVRVLRPRIEEAGLQVDTAIAPQLSAKVEEADLHDVVGNLLENAVRHARTRVRISAERVDAALVLRIEDDGEGLHGAGIDDAMRRGNSMDGGPGATGMGLSIARDMVESYEGVFELGRSDLGGLLITITLAC
ncbi:sensor histidine kinase [Minwuia sp.]|uniref:sensor histidine kinase n=1 Tax=Minwuia sp. TaxID=2493630 RepID=UPI003A940839